MAKKRKRTSDVPVCSKCGKDQWMQHVAENSKYLNCPTGLVLELYPEFYYQEKSLFADYNEYCQEIWDENVVKIVKPGPYIEDTLKYDIGGLLQKDWLCLRDHLEKQHQERERRKRMTLQYQYERIHEYGQRVSLASVAFFLHVVKGTAEGIEAAVRAIKTNKTNVPTAPMRWHVKRIKNAWKERRLNA